VRAVTPALLDLFSKKNCIMWANMQAANSPLAIYLDVDFEIISRVIHIEKNYLDDLNSKKISAEELDEMIKTKNNIAKEYRIIMEAIK